MPMQIPSRYRRLHQVKNTTNPRPQLPATCSQGPIVRSSVPVAAPSGPSTGSCVMHRSSTQAPRSTGKVSLISSLTRVVKPSANNNNNNSNNNNNNNNTNMNNNSKNRNDNNELNDSFSSNDTSFSDNSTIQNESLDSAISTCHSMNSSIVSNNNNKNKNNNKHHNNNNNQDSARVNGNNNGESPNSSRNTTLSSLNGSNASGTETGSSTSGNSSFASSISDRDEFRYNAPMSATEAIRRYGRYLSDEEIEEMKVFEEIWYFGQNADRISRPGGPFNQPEYDDENGNYKIIEHDHIAFRYEILEVIGKGSFGQVIRALDHKTNTHVAIKIIRNKKRFVKQAVVELKVLYALLEKDADGTNNVIHILGYTCFRKHLCISFELMSLNLYELIKKNNHNGFSMSLIRRFCGSIIKCLRLLYKENIIHCDLKPENILLKQRGSSSIKVIDFGSSCYADRKIYTYIQSRFYRSPEVILGLSYGTPIDMWSLGCVLAELYTGYPLFPGENEEEQLACIMEILGLPPKDLIATAVRRRWFFDSRGLPRFIINSKGRVRTPGKKSLSQAIVCNDRHFLNFLERCLEWDPAERMTPDEAAQHEFLQPMSAIVQRWRTSTPILNSPSSTICLDDSFTTIQKPYKFADISPTTSRGGAVVASITNTNTMSNTLRTHNNNRNSTNSTVMTNNNNLNNTNNQKSSRVSGGDVHRHFHLPLNNNPTNTNENKNPISSSVVHLRQRVKKPPVVVNNGRYIVVKNEPPPSVCTHHNHRQVGNVCKCVEHKLQTAPPRKLLSSSMQVNSLAKYITNGVATLGHVQHTSHQNRQQHTDKQHGDHCEHKELTNPRTTLSIQNADGNNGGPINTSSNHNHNHHIKHSQSTGDVSTMYGGRT